MTNKEIIDRLIKAAESDIINWRKADKLTPIEQETEILGILSGIGRAALFLLPEKDYYKFKDELRKRGYSI